jgi:hypothetical protein
MPVHVNTAAVKKIIYLSDYQGSFENIADEGRVPEESLFDGETERENNVTKWGSR